MTGSKWTWVSSVLVITFVNFQAQAQEAFPTGTQIVWSDPPDGHIDVGQAKDAGGRPDGIAIVYVRFDRPVELTVESVVVASTAAPAPQIESLSGGGSEWVVLLDGPLAAGETGAVAFGGGAATLVFASRPGDVNHDGTTDETDVAVLKDAVARDAQDLEAFDFDRNGEVSEDDAKALQEFVQQNTDHHWSGDPTKLEKLTCCCAGTECSQSFGSHCAAGPEVACPCSGGNCS